MPDAVDPIALKEHMFGSAKADAFGSETPGDDRIVRRIGIGADAKFAILVDTLHECLEASADLRLDYRNLTDNDAAGRTIEGDEIALLDRPAIRDELLCAVIDDDITATGDAAFAHAARYDRRAAE